MGRAGSGVPAGFHGRLGFESKRDGKLGGGGGEGGRSLTSVLIPWAGLVGGRQGAGKRGCGEMAQAT